MSGNQTVAAWRFRGRILSISQESSPTPIDAFDAASMNSGPRCCGPTSRLHLLRQGLPPSEAAPADTAKAPSTVSSSNPDEDDDAQLAEAPAQFPPVERVLVHTRGKNAPFVSNRADELLRDRLISSFDFGGLDWRELSPRRVEAAIESIAAGTYDLVLAATGFLPHKEDSRLNRACRSAGVPYVRVNKGRPKAVEMAIDREMADRP